MQFGSIVAMCMRSSQTTTCVLNSCLCGLGIKANLTGDANSVLYPDGYAKGGILKGPMYIGELLGDIHPQGSKTIIAGIPMGKYPSGATLRIEPNVGNFAGPATKN